jgi:hypothetical protein
VRLCFSAPCPKAVTNAHTHAQVSHHHT